MSKHIAYSINQSCGIYQHPSANKHSKVKDTKMSAWPLVRISSVLCHFIRLPWHYIRLVSSTININECGELAVPCLPLHIPDVDTQYLHTENSRFCLFVWFWGYLYSCAVPLIWNVPFSTNIQQAFTWRFYFFDINFCDSLYLPIIYYIQLKPESTDLKPTLYIRISSRRFLQMLILLSCLNASSFFILRIIFLSVLILSLRTAHLTKVLKFFFNSD